MTSELITELRKAMQDAIDHEEQIGDERVSISIPDRYALTLCRDHVTRLLDEREALLETARKVLDELFGPSTHPTVAALRDAIAKAETP